MIIAMDNSSESIEKQIVEATWEDIDYEYMSQYIIYKQLGLKNINELEF